MTESPADIKQIFERAGGYSPQCIPFIHDGLAHTVTMVHADQPKPELGLESEDHHVTGHQLCIGLREHAIKRYGLMSRAVLRKWGIRSTRDFGAIIFAMVEAGLIRKTDEDTIEDFDGVYEFDEAFADPSLELVEPSA